MKEAEQPQVFYVDPEGTGHHLALYARALWREFASRGWRIVWVTSPHAHAHSAGASLLAEFRDQVRVIEGPFPPAPSAGEQPFQTLAYQWRHCQALRIALAKAGPAGPADCVFHACLDQCDRVFGLRNWGFAGRPWAALHMTAALDPTRQGPHHPGSPLKAALSRTLTWHTYRNSALQRIFVLDQGFANFALRQDIPGAAKIHFVPDLRLPARHLDRTAARVKQCLLENEKSILCFGMMTERKGVGLLLRALRAHPPGFAICIVIAGEQNSSFEVELQSELQKAPLPTLRVDVRRRFMSDDEQAELFASADLVWVGYPGFRHPSGVVELASAHRVPCIGGSNTAIADEIGRRGCGVICDLDQPKEIAETIYRVLETPGLSARPSTALAAPSGAAEIVHELARLAASIRGSSRPQASSKTSPSRTSDSVRL